MSSTSHVSVGPPTGSTSSETKQKTAVIVCHGMGQQVPFETIESVAQALKRIPGSNPEGKSVPETKVRIVRLGEKQLPRAELEIPKDGNSKEVHVYEAYWAPITEGKVTLRDVHSFLIDAGWNSIFNCLLGPQFTRWIFGGFKTFKVKRLQIIFSFALALALLWSFTLINAVILAVATARSLTSTITAWPSNSLLADLSLDVLVLSVVFLFLGLILFLSLKFRAFRNSIFLHVVNGVVWATLLVTPLIGLLMLFHLIHHRDLNAGVWWRGPITHLIISGIESNARLHAIPIAATWAALLYVSKKVRWFLVQYVGDVAAYISTQALNKFYNIRQQIQRASMSVARAVYQAKTANENEAAYSNIVIVGHSLGSVVAYDTLNALILEDTINNQANRVLARTSALITFGSPLDKTAFIFRTQQERHKEIREALAAAVQPMIVSYTNRPPQWINIYSPRDWISGSLEYYDTPGESENPQHIKNIQDRAANVPLAAHTQYWDNELLSEILYKTL